MLSNNWQVLDGRHTEMCEFNRDEFFRRRGMKMSCGLDRVAALEGVKKGG